MTDKIQFNPNQCRISQNDSKNDVKMEKAKNVQDS